jgi:hypothetical protein
MLSQRCSRMPLNVKKVKLPVTASAIHTFILVVLYPVSYVCDTLGFLGSLDLRLLHALG